MKLAVFVAAGLMVSGTAFAQSAEETAAFLTFGFRDGGTMGDSKQQGIVRKLSDNPLKLHLDTGKSMTITLTVTQPKHCFFRMQVSDVDHDPKIRSDITYDFSKFTGLENSMGMFTRPVFSGECAITNESEGCVEPFIGARQLFVPIASSQAAADYMKSKFCAGRAF
ncbi:hypothetical protein [Rhizobium lentis]|uniref:hypothetical protein n=1 Tax=Rhizobium lentis TaxID=1138194 RepID=UPI001A92BCC6|nr:hypothetical protein [Rhizobium lentis]MBX5063187.1 hypothetical protein [Rhizobium lentis]MBX5075292.1 hypothetical protein [Rhizobium lentis]QSW92955.1 hypothetical protein J0663_18000 [Rhizobium lentis]